MPERNVAERKEGTLKLHPFISVSPKVPFSGCKADLIFRAGFAWGERETPEPMGLAAIWLWRGRYVARRTQEPDGRLREHYKLKHISFEFEAAGKMWRLRVGRPWRRPLVAETLSLR